jgi:hypothetical protein
VHRAAVPDGDAGAPLPHDEAAVGELVREQREAEHGHPRPDALQDGVPAAVREEGGDGGVGEHLHLAAPLDDEAAARGGRGLGEALGQRARVVGADDVRAHDPQEPGAAGQHAARDLAQLLLGHVRVAAEGDVEHGAGRLRAQPPRAVVGLGPHGRGHGAAREARREDGAHGVEGPVGAQRGDGRRLQLLHGVAQDVVGAAGLVERPEDDAVDDGGGVRILKVRHELARLDGRHARDVGDRVLARICISIMHILLCFSEIYIGPAGWREYNGSAWYVISVTIDQDACIYKVDVALQRVRLGNTLLWWSGDAQFQ